MIAAWPFGDLPLFGFDLIMCDPPWRFETWSEAGKLEKSPERHYDTMPLEAIEALPVGHLAAKDCLLWLWATHPMLPQQLGVIPRWGFRYVTSGVWVKRTARGLLGFGTGYRLRSASEPFLLATNGDPTTAKNVRTVIEGRLRENSRKPDEAYVEAERMMPEARRLDLFSRETRPGWTAWGNQTGLFDERAA